MVYTYMVILLMQNKNYEADRDHLMDLRNVAKRETILRQNLIEYTVNLLQIFLVNGVYFSNDLHHFDDEFLAWVFQLWQDIVEYY